ncbi:glutamate-gated chloride channel [Caerostris darwini]|uniref:Glutamate-gated chloride channel n=1 Tax=Caerostris darwini TaxID=1538125 RepID=A0AAV4NYF6_9ARAC|nr:glutamate-gated chloride channel [Caerostris darwini]
MVNNNKGELHTGSKETYVADIFMSQSWKDDRLQLPENMTSKYRLLPLNWLKKMWRPDSFFKNAKKVTFQEMTIPNHYIWLYSDKTILYMVKLTLELSCAMKFEAYPHDTQTCSLKMESLSYTTDDLIFDWEPQVPLVVEQTIELPQHILVETKLGNCMQQYSTVVNMGPAKRSKHSAGFKIKGIQFAEENDNRAAARRFDVSESFVREH